MPGAGHLPGALELPSASIKLSVDVESVPAEVERHCCLHLSRLAGVACAQVSEPCLERPEAACCSKAHTVRRQPFLADEAQIFKMLRCYTQQHLCAGSPFWLYGAQGISRREAPSILQLQQILFRSMTGTPMAEKVSLFVPLLWHTPVANNAELLKLLQGLADAYDPSFLRLAASLKSRGSMCEAWLLQMGADPMQSCAAAGRTM